MFPQIGDAINDLNRNIQHLNRTLGASDLVGDDGSGDNGPDRWERGVEYYTTGPKPVALDELDWEDISFGITAKVVNIRFTDDIVLAFTGEDYPEDRQGIGLMDVESPYNVGGNAPIGARKVWVKPAETSQIAQYNESPDSFDEEPPYPAVQIIAHR